MVVNCQRRISFPVHRLKDFLRRLSQTLGLRTEAFTVALVSDAHIHALNRRFRGQARTTDVLAFPLRKHGSTSAGNGYLGDVVISLETARRQARHLGHSLAKEVRLLILHGVLHLLGYDHETDRGEMNRRERTLRCRLGLE